MEMDRKFSHQGNRISKYFEKSPISLARHFSEMQSCWIGGKVHLRKAERQSGPVLFAKVVEYGTAT